MSSPQIFTPQEIDSVRRAGTILRECLELCAEKAEEGVTTLELDALAEEFIRSHDGATPAFQGTYGYPATLCTSVNADCVHGIPTDYCLQSGDIVALDCGVMVDKLYTDACVSKGIGTLDADAKRLLSATKSALDSVMPLVQEGRMTGDISAHIEQFALAHGCKAVRSLTGHGLGYEIHQPPDIPNVGTKGTGMALPANTVIAIEPIFSLGTDQVMDKGDNWTITTKDGSLSAHFEHTILVLEDGYEILA